MKSKPTGPRFRNLYAWRGSIWYERVAGGRRFRVDTGTCYGEDGPAQRHWDEAALYRDRYEDAKGIGRPALYTGAMPTFAELAERYLEEDTAHLAAPRRLRVARKSD